jgi:hypothetical protein
MLRHDHDQSETDVARTKPARQDAEPALLWKAAAAGRGDVVGANGMQRLQRAVGNTAARSLADEERSPVLDVLRSGSGRPLEEPVRADMEARLGHDFSGVRVHTDDAAGGSAASVNAHAYTVGSNIVFQRDRYDPGSDSGRTMLAHELTHVVQQRSGPVDGTPSGGGIRVSDPSDRFEREAAATAERVMSAPAPIAPQRTAEVGGTALQRSLEDSTPGDSVQRAADEEKEDEAATAQGTFVQREEDEEEQG